MLTIKRKSTSLLIDTFDYKTRPKMAIKSKVMNLFNQ